MSVRRQLPIMLECLTTGLIPGRNPAHFYKRWFCPVSLAQTKSAFGERTLRSEVHNDLCMLIDRSLKGPRGSHSITSKAWINATLVYAPNNLLCSNDSVPRLRMRASQRSV